MIRPVVDHLGVVDPETDAVVADGLESVITRFDDLDLPGPAGAEVVRGNAADRRGTAPVEGDSRIRAADGGSSEGLIGEVVSLQAVPLAGRVKLRLRNGDEGCLSGPKPLQSSLGSAGVVVVLHLDGDRLPGSQRDCRTGVGG